MTGPTPPENAESQAAPPGDPAPPSGFGFDLSPADDLGLATHERNRSVRREAGLLTAAGYRLARMATRAYLAVAHRPVITGREHLPASAPFVVIANHTSHLDSPLLTAALPAQCCRDVYPLAAGDHFFGSRGTAAAASIFVNALPVDRKHGGRHAIADLRARLVRRKCIYLLFPEGTRSADGTLGAFRPGVGMLLAAQPVPAVPAYIEGAHRCWPRDRRLPRPGRLRVRFGPPLDFADLPDARAGWTTAAERSAAAVAALATDSTAG